MEIPKDELLKIFELMVTIRTFEKTAEQNFLQGEMPGFIHLYIGEEAIAAGIISQLRKDDFITSTHRGHGHMIAKGADLKKMMAELYGKKTGYCKGKGGSMHIMSFDIGVLGANGVVAGGLPIAAGAGMAIKLRETDQVVVSFFGDGATGRGAFHEALNWASVYNLPIIFVNENNQYASTAKYERVVPVKSIAERAMAYNMPGVSVDGNDLFKVYEVANEAIRRAREGNGPTLIEARTYRLKGHFVGDPEKYRKKEEIEEWWKKEPIGRVERYLIEKRILDEEEKRKICNRANEKVREAVEFARISPFPEKEDALTDLFVDDFKYDYY
ncbi:MAG TPA: thiamine pyrophosphate-dependent dehydrogenase E1 component subunit alpha [Candidatus Atribacteria bacterium]|nr:thiamine pyrophosphate-dependent dehydrogenase E1 component subunit alpha [Candidatus Atribacteria bacterium]